jgi:hypothetical protein
MRLATIAIELLIRSEARKENARAVNLFEALELSRLKRELLAQSARLQITIEQ